MKILLIRYDHGYDKIVSFSIDIFPWTSFTERYIQNICFFDSSNALQTASLLNRVPYMLAWSTCQRAKCVPFSHFYVPSNRLANVQIFQLGVPTCQKSCHFFFFACQNVCQFSNYFSKEFCFFIYLINVYPIYFIYSVYFKYIYI